MKRNNINGIIKLGIFSLVVSIVGSSCLKSVSGNTDFSSLKPTVIIPEGGMSNFGLDALLFPPTDAVDTTFFHLNYAATDVAPKDEAITLAVDTKALDAYNALGGAQYEKFPDSIFSFTSTSINIKKGNNYSDNIPLVLFPGKIDLTKNYMLPISITTVPAGSTISGNYTTIYYHLVGNPIAGVYNREWVRYNNAAGTGAPFRDRFADVVIAPIDGTTVQAPSGSAGLVYVITFDQNGSTLSNFQVSFTSASVAASGVAITGGPTVVSANPITGVYKFNFTYDNLAGGLRNITDTYTKK